MSQTQRAGGQKALGTVESEIEATNTTNQLRNITGTLAVLDAVEPALQQASQLSTIDPNGAQSFYQQFLQQLPPNARQIMPRTYGPQVHETLKKVRSSLMNSVVHLQKMEELEKQGKTSKEVATISGQAAVQTAGIRANAKAQNLMQRFIAAKTPYERWSFGEQILADPDIDQATKDKITPIVNQAKQLLSEQIAKGQFVMPGFPGSGDVANQINQRLGSGSPGMDSGAGLIPFGNLKP